MKVLINQYTTVLTGKAIVAQIDDCAFCLTLQFMSFGGDANEIIYYSYGELSELIKFVKDNFVPISAMVEAFMKELRLGK